jgi:hypothetical protein
MVEAMTPPARSDAATIDEWAKQLCNVVPGLHSAPWEELYPTELDDWRIIARHALTLHAQAVAAAVAQGNELAARWMKAAEGAEQRLAQAVREERELKIALDGFAGCLHLFTNHPVDPAWVQHFAIASADFRKSIVEVLTALRAQGPQEA